MIIEPKSKHKNTENVSLVILGTVGPVGLVFFLLATQSSFGTERKNAMAWDYMKHNVPTE